MAVTFLVNSRHILMGATLVPLLARFPKRKVLPALFLMTDESWALSYSDAQKRAGRGTLSFSLPYYLGASLSFYAMWVGFTALGALAGPVLGDVHRYGFDMAPGGISGAGPGYVARSSQSAAVADQFAGGRGGVSLYTRRLVRYRRAAGRVSGGLAVGEK